MLDVAGTAYRAVRSKSWRWRSTGATNVAVNGKHMNLHFRKRGASVATLATAGALVCAAPALAQAPVALVEEVRGRPAGIEFMDYVSAGKVIKLGRQDSIVLGYLRSCWHETIMGGTVIVGAEQSDVRGGEVVRSKVKCDGGNIALTPGQANQSAGTSYRDASQKPTMTLYGLSPVIEAAGGSTVLVVRTDRQGEYHVAHMPAKQGKQRSFFDFATAKKTLTAGGTYWATNGSGRILFAIDPGAKALGVPIISRLLRFPPAS